MNIVATFDPSAAVTGTFVPNLSNGIGKIVVWNESNWALDVTFTDGTTDLAPAWTATIFNLLGPSGKITWTQDTQLTASTPPISKVWVVAYRNNEAIPGVFPLALVRQANLGNSVNLSTSTTSLVNDANALATQIIESTPTGAASSTISVLNDGTVVLKGDVAGVLTALLQTIPGAAAGASSVKLGDAARTVEVLGALQVDGNADTTGTLTIDGASSLDNGQITSDGTGNLTVNQILLTVGSLARISHIHVASLKSTGASIAHGLGAVPTCAFIVVSGAGIFTDTASIDYTNFTSSHLTATSTSAGGVPVDIIAIKF